MSSLLLDPDILKFILGFWLFVFWKPFRDEWREDYRKEDSSGKVEKIIYAIVSISLGLVLPCVLVYFLLKK